MSCTKNETKTKPVKDVIPLTVSNMRGHRMLYNEGWFVVTSSAMTFNLAKEMAIKNSAQAIREVAIGIKNGTIDYIKSWPENFKQAYELAVKIVKVGHQVTSSIFAATHYLGQKQLDNSNNIMHKSLDAFIKGNITIGKRTAEDRARLAELPKDMFLHLKDDFTNLHQLVRDVKKSVGRSIKISWGDSFAHASAEFKKEYEESGNRRNSIEALGDVLHGWLKAFYLGIVNPGAKTIVKATVKGLKYGVFLPVASVVIVTGRVIQSTGLVFFYTGKMGLKIISPTIESGFLAAIGILSYTSIPVIYSAGAGIGAFSQVAFSTIAPAAGTTKGAVNIAASTGKYAASTVYDVVKGTTKVAINQLATGAVLGYNALTAIPAHLYLGTIDAAVFLAWDGPRLVIALATGAVTLKDSKKKDVKVSMGSLPVGTVVDLKQLKKQPGVKVRIISKDPEVIKNVINKAPEDLRRK